MSLSDAELIRKALPGTGKVSIGGGEPFMHKDLEGICHIFSSLPITIPTNGQNTEQIITTTRNIIERESVGNSSPRKQAVNLTIAVSLDGFEKDNDRIRGSGSYKKALKTLKELKVLQKEIYKTRGLHLGLKVNTVITAENTNNLVSFAKFINSLKPDFHSMLLLRGSPNDPDMELPTISELKKITPELFKVLAKYQFSKNESSFMTLLKKRYQRYIWETSLKVVSEGKAVIPCSAPWMSRVVYPDGRISMCELTSPQGNILMETESRIEKRMRKRLKNIEVASGPCCCTHNCNMLDNTMADPYTIIRIVAGLNP